MRRISISRISISLLTLIASGILGILAPLPAAANDRAVSLTATPAILDTGGKAGTEVKATFQLTNNSSAILPIHLSARDTQIREGQSPEEVESMSATSWVSFTQPDFVFQANQTKTIETVLHIPHDASPGGHYADLVASPLSLEGDKELISTRPELVVQLLIAVPGEITENLTAELSSPGTVITSQPSETALSFTVTNHGNSHTLFQPNIHVTAKNTDSVVTELHSEIILPGESKQISFSPPADMSAGAHNVELQLRYGTPIKEEGGQIVRLVVLPFSPLVLLVLPAGILILYGVHIRQRVLQAVKIIIKGNTP